MSSSGPRGENAELRAELHSNSNTRKKDALKRTIAAMTVGKDVSSLFPDVVQCIQTPQLELKKLVYLYLINYAQSNPDLAILAVNTFVKDATDYNPLLRALAIRTMACIPVDKIAEYLCQPLRSAIDDPEPYVRKTAAMAIAKLYDVNPDLVRQEGFIALLAEKLLKDENAIVTSNAVAALADIAAKDPSAKEAVIKRSSMPVLLSALDKCNEWGQVFILDAISSPSFLAENHKLALAIIDRISPRLQHANPAVVLSSIRVIANNIGLLSSVSSADVLRSMYKRIAAPLVTFMSAEPETQYVALRCTNLLIRVHPTLISHDVKVFFCKYNDPLYVKMEKLLLIVRLTEKHNLNQVLLELNEYAIDIDPLFVQGSIAAISSIAVKSESHAERCVEALVDLLASKTINAIEQSVQAMRVVFRKFPDRFTNVAVLISGLDYAEFDDPEAKAAFIWVLGEFPGLIPEVTTKLGRIVELLSEESLPVQLQLLTTCVKVSLILGDDLKGLVDQVVRYSCSQRESPILRERGVYFDRLLRSEPSLVSKIVLSKKPVVTDTSQDLELALLQALIDELGLISSIFHLPSTSFVAGGSIDEKEANLSNLPISAVSGDMLDLGSSGGLPQPPAKTSVLAIKSQAQQSAGSLLDDIFGSSLPAPKASDKTGTGEPSEPVKSIGQPTGLGLDMDELLGLPAPQPSPGGPLATKLPELDGTTPNANDLLSSAMQNARLSARPLPASGGLGQGSNFADARPNREMSADIHGMTVMGSLTRQNDEIKLVMNIVNNSTTAVGNFAVQLNDNAFGLVPANSLSLQTLEQGKSAETTVTVQPRGKIDSSKGCVLQVAIRCLPLKVQYFATTVEDIGVVLEANSRLEKAPFLQKWASIPDSQEVVCHLKTGSPIVVQSLVTTLSEKRIFLVAKTSKGGTKLYLSAIVVGSRAALLCEVTVVVGQLTASLAIRGEPGIPQGITQLMQKTVQGALP